MGMFDTTSSIREGLVELENSFQEDEYMSEITLPGELGFHTFYKRDADRVTQGMRTVLHQAFERVISEFLITDEGVEENWGEVSSVTVANEVEERFGELGVPGFGRVLAPEVEEILRGRE